MNSLVKQIINDDGEHVPKDEQLWHVVGCIGGDAAVLCSGEFIGTGCDSGNGALYVTKEVRRGGITCERCIEIVKTFKHVKL